MTVTLERARAFDAPAISTIMSDWIDETDWMPQTHSPNENRGFGKWLIDVTDVTVARSGQDVIGFLARREHNIHSLYLASSFRRQGVGRALLDHAKNAQEHLELWTFQANTVARRFYAQNRFVEDELTDGTGNDEKLPDVHLIWAKESG